MDFGIIVIVSESDIHFAKGCCASIRHFMPDTPICLLVDGEFELEGLDTAFGSKVIRKNDVKNPFLRKRSFGWGTTRMIAFWESPFEYFLMIDSDTCIWGNMEIHADFEKFDIILDDPNCNYSDESINKFFFDTSKIERLYSDFDYGLYRERYVCPAVLFGRRGTLSLEHYKAIMDTHKENPGTFFMEIWDFLTY